VPIRKLDSRVFNKLGTALSNDDLIVNFLDKVNKAVPPSTIVLATGLSPAKVSQRLKQLVKYKRVRVFYRKLPLYSIRRD
jgi:hypothetical protein